MFLPAYMCVVMSKQSLTLQLLRASVLLAGKALDVDVLLLDYTPQSQCHTIAQHCCLRNHGDTQSV